MSADTSRSSGEKTVECVCKFCVDEVLSLRTRLTECEKAMRNVLDQFERIKEHQRKLLIEGQTLETASENWDEATSGHSIDFTLLKDALKSASGEGGKNG